MPLEIQRQLLRDAWRWSRSRGWGWGGFWSVSGRCRCFNCVWLLCLASVRVCARVCSYVLYNLWTSVAQMKSSELKRPCLLLLLTLLSVTVAIAVACGFHMLRILPTHNTHTHWPTHTQQLHIERCYCWASFWRHLIFRACLVIKQLKMILINLFISDDVHSPPPERWGESAHS